MVASVVSSIMIGLIRWTPFQQKYFGDNDVPSKSHFDGETCSYSDFLKCAACASSPCSLSPWCHGWRLPPTQLKALKLFPGTFSHFLLPNISLQFLSLPLDKWSLLSDKWYLRQNGTGVFPPKLLQSQEGNGKGETSPLILTPHFAPLISQIGSHLLKALITMEGMIYVSSNSHLLFRWVRAFQNTEYSATQLVLSL